MVREVAVGSATVHNVTVRGNLAYVAWYTAGAQIIDITNPEDPVIVGYLDSYTQNNNSGYAGAWGIYPYYPSGKFIISDMQTGLYVGRYAPGVTSVEDEILPANFSLSQNFPNPFNPATTVSFTLPREEHIRLSVLNVLGQELFVVAEGNRSPGTHHLTIDAGRFATGVYFYKLTAGVFVEVKKMVLLK
jgi:hypothetical protein